MLPVSERTYICPHGTSSRLQSGVYVHLDGGECRVDTARQPSVALGTVTTFGMLRELLARAEATVPATSDSTVMAAMVSVLVRSLSHETLAYRTVDG